MNFSCYQYPIEKKLKRIGSVTTYLKQITKIKYKKNSDYSLITPFTYKVFKNGLDGNRKLNTIIEFSDQKLYLILSKWQRRKMYLMFKSHWYFNNLITRFYVKYINIISPLAMFGIQGFKLYKATIGLFATAAVFKGCH